MYLPPGLPDSVYTARCSETRQRSTRASKRREERHQPTETTKSNRNISISSTGCFCNSPTAIYTRSDIPPSTSLTLLCGVVPVGCLVSFASNNLSCSPTGTTIISGPPKQQRQTRLLQKPPADSKTRFLPPPTADPRFAFFYGHPDGVCQPLASLWLFFTTAAAIATDAVCRETLYSTHCLTFYPTRIPSAERLRLLCALILRVA